jgi:hypothetical protein
MLSRQLSQVSGQQRLKQVSQHHMSLAAVPSDSAVKAPEKLSPKERLKQKLLQRIQVIESRMEKRLHEA